MRFVFGDNVLDLARRELRRGSELVRLDPQVFDLLIYLIENRHRVVSKDDMLAAVWAGRIVSESALATRIYAARNAIGDTGKAQCTIELAHEDFKAMLGNPQVGMQLYFQGKLRVTGDPMLATKLQQFFAMTSAA